MAKIEMSDTLPAAEIEQARRQFAHLARRSRSWGKGRNVAVVAFTTAQRLMGEALEAGKYGMKQKPPPMTQALQPVERDTEAPKC